MNITQFLRDTKAEMRHVVWPSKTKAFVYAAIVIGLSLLVGYFLGALDNLFQAGLRNIIF